jgi:hypothetical protein
LAGKCGQGYLWTAPVLGQFVIYEWHASRAARCLDSRLGFNYAARERFWLLICAVRFFVTGGIVLGTYSVV